MKNANPFFKGKIIGLSFPNFKFQGYAFYIEIKGINQNLKKIWKVIYVPIFIK